MKKTEWTKKLATGIRIIDNQHIVFLNACSNLVNHADKSLAKSKIAACLEKLEKIAAEHFLTEENLMKESYYTDKKGHIKLHGYFMDELKTVKSRAAAGETGPKFAKEIKEKLADWFIIHIEKNDVKMAHYLVKA